jgi:hypothetical protein
MINDEACVHFLAQLTALQAECPAERIINFDESSWSLVMVSERLIAERGAEVIPGFTEADSEACFTFFATCAADGSKFPLILMAKRRIGRGYKQVGSLKYSHEVRHMSSGLCHEN